MGELWGKIKGTVAAIAPALGNAILPGIGGIGGSILSEALGVDGDDPVKVLDILQRTPPSELSVRLLEIQANNKERLAELAIEDKRVDNQDTDSARKAEIERRKTGDSNWVQDALAILITLGFFVSLGILVFASGAIPDGKKEIAYIMFGVLGSEFGSVCKYFFGSSRGSSDKTKLLMGLGK